MHCLNTYTQFLYPSTKKHNSLDPGFYKYLPGWFISGWRSSMSSCFFCNSSWTSVSFSLSRGKNMEFWSQTDLRMKTIFCHITFMDCGEVTCWSLLSSPVKWEQHLPNIIRAVVKISGTWWVPKMLNFSTLPHLPPKKVKGNILRDKHSTSPHNRCLLCKLFKWH